MEWTEEAIAARRAVLAAEMEATRSKYREYYQKKQAEDEHDATPPPSPPLQAESRVLPTKLTALTGPRGNSGRQKDSASSKPEKRLGSPLDNGAFKINRRSQAPASTITQHTPTTSKIPATSTVTTSQYSSTKRVQPAWYRNLGSTNKRDKQKTGADISLDRLKTLITRCKTPLAPRDQMAAYQQVRDRLHTLMFEQVDEILVRSKRMLHDNDGLPQVFDDAFAGNASWPWDIKADAEEIYNKWAARQFDTHLFKGIILGKSKKAKNGKTKGDSTDSSVDRLEPGAVEKYKLMDNKTHGNGALLNGQWWPAQLCTMRDGAHGATISGISGRAGEGAYSVIIAGGNDAAGQPYPNVDNGDEILYCGTDSTTGIPSDGTQRLSESARNGKPIRLLRSHNVKGPYAPEIGFRYDGLYQVLGTEMMDPPESKRQRHRFKMMRLAGQDPVRGGSGPEKRPTRQEFEAYGKDQRLRGR